MWRFLRISLIEWLTRTTFRIISLTMIIPVWGFSSAGRAPALQAGGRGFESLKLHQTGDKLNIGRGLSPPDVL